MLDRQSCNLYILVNTQGIGSGGDEYILSVEDKVDSTEYEVKFYTDAIATDAIIREKLVSEVKKILLKHIVKTDIVDKIKFSVDIESEKDTVEVEEIDKWDSWIFSVGFGGYFSSESTYNSQDWNFRLSANRVTEKHKFLFSSRYDREVSNFLFSYNGEEETITNITNAVNSHSSYAYSISDHWSVGLFANYRNSIFSNYKHSMSLSPGIEYNIFKYDDAATNRISFAYKIGSRYNNYIDTTTYFKDSETILTQNLSMDLEFVKDWGDIYFYSGVNHFISLPDRFSIFLSPGFSVNLFKGFRFNAYLSYSITKDLINIPKGDLAVEEVLLRNKLRDSNYSFYSNMGFSYRFGSASNNVVNPRF